MQERKLIPSAVVDEILSLNYLDVELYKHAEKLYAKQEKFLLSMTQLQVFHHDYCLLGISYTPFVDSRASIRVIT